MFYIYFTHVDSGKTDFSRVCEDEREAIKIMAGYYESDKRVGKLGDYYYFMKQH